MQTQYKSKHAYIIWFTISVFFFYQYILRVAPGVMMEEIRNYFQITAQEYATLGTFYFLTYALMQVPLGILVDRYGVRKIVSISIAMCVISILVFAFSKVFWLAQISRVVLGLGSACALMCAMKTTVDNFPEHKRGVLMGTTLTFGMLGPLVSGRPLAEFIQHMGGHDALFVLAIPGAILLLMAQIFMPKSKDKQESQYSTREIFKEISAMLKTRAIIIYSLMTIGLYAPLSIMIDLWGTSFIMETYQLNKADSVSIAMIGYMGLAIGSIAVPFIAGKLNRLHATMVICLIAILIVFCLILYVQDWSLSTIGLLIFLLGFFSGAEMLCFTCASINVKTIHTGTCLSLINTFNMLGNAVMEQVVGHLLDWRWQDALTVSGLRHYTSSDYVFALSSLAVTIVISLIATIWLSSIRKVNLTV